MNCASCGGTTTADAVGVLTCGYCRSVRFAGSGDGPDGVAVVGPEGDVACPSGCGRLSGGVLDGRPVAVCPTCRGLLLATTAFGPIVADRRARWKGAEARPEPIDPADLARRTECPGCGRPMDTHPYYGPGHAVIDSCAGCGFVWLDAGEVARIERAPGRR